jgi:hypothetical protein
MVADFSPDNRYGPWDLWVDVEVWPAGIAADDNAKRRDGSEADEDTNRHYARRPVDG